MEKPTKSDAITSDTSIKEVKTIILALEAIVEESHDAIIGKTIDGIIVSWNSGATRMFGYTREEMLGKSLTELFTPERKDELPMLLEKIRKGETIEYYDSIWVKKDGTSADVEFSISPVHGDKGLIVGTSLVGRDITDRKKNATAILESKKFLDNIINSIADPIFVKNNEHQFIIANDALCKMLAMSRESIIGKTLGESLPKDQMDIFLEKDRLVLESGQENVNEESLTAGNGEILDIVTKKTRYVDGNGNKFLVAVIRDVSKQKQKERQLQEKIAEIEKVNTLMIDRELKMVELKDELEKAKKQRKPR